MLLITYIIDMILDYDGSTISILVLNNVID